MENVISSCLRGADLFWLNRGQPFPHEHAQDSVLNIDSTNFRLLPIRLRNYLAQCLVAVLAPNIATSREKDWPEC